MTAGYFIENILSLMLALILFYLRDVGEGCGQKLRWKRVIIQTYDTFWNCAIFLTFSIQIATIVALVRVDYGISAVGMGALTKEITWTVSILSLIPLVYATFLPTLFTISKEREVVRKPSSEEEVYRSREAKYTHGLRFLFFFVCWFLSIYSFVTSMMNRFGRSQIGASGSPGVIISTGNWTNIEDICWKGVSGLSVAEQTAMDCFSILTWISLTLLVLGKIIKYGLGQQCINSAMIRLFRHVSEEQRTKLFNMLKYGLLAIFPILGIGLIWTYLRLQQLQFQVTDANESADTDNQWTFGQVVAVTIFAPVLVDLCLWARITR